MTVVQEAQVGLFIFVFLIESYILKEFLSMIQHQAQLKKHSVRTRNFCVDCPKEKLDF